MSPNEIYVLEALKSKYGGDFTDGEDPPDAYLYIGKKKVAVEVTRLVEQVEGKKGKRTSRLAQDIPAVNLANEIDRELGRSLPNGRYVMLVVPAPINNIRRTKELLINAILERVENGPLESEIEIERNLISINIYDEDRPSGKKVIGAVTNRYSSSNIHENSKFLLEDRIESKAKKCVRYPGMDEYWLALYNDYWIADAESYSVAYEQIDIEHEFDKVLVINGYGEVHQICQT